MPDAIDLCTRDDVRLKLGHQARSTGRDAEIDDAISDASERIIDYCEREFAPVSAAGTVRTFTVTPRRVTRWRDWREGVLFDLNPYDLQTATEVVLNPANSPITLTAGTEYDLWPEPSRWGVYNRIRLNGRLIGLNLPAWTGWFEFSTTQLHTSLQITGTWGFPEVPRAVRRACIITVASWLDIRVGAYAPQDDTSGRTVMPDTSGGLDIPNSAKRMLETFKRAMNA